MRASIVFVLALAAAPAAAQADVTVVYAEPAPMRPLVAVPVTSSVSAALPVIESTAAPAPTVSASSPTTSREPAAAVSAPAPTTAPATPPASSSECVVPSPVRFIRTTDGSREARLLHLTDCRGAPDADALLELSILARPRTADRPDARDLAAHANDPELYASEVRRLDPGLLTRLQVIADRFPGHDIELTSGYRPDANETSRHRTGHALDVRVVDAPLEEVHAVALLLDESGVGLYPTSEFLHVDVRPRITRWVDTAGPGEPANMVEVVNGRDGHAASAPALRWPASPAAAAAPSTPTPAPARRRTTARSSAAAEEEQRAALRDALEALDALEGIDFQMP